MSTHFRSSKNTGDRKSSGSLSANTFLEIGKNLSKMVRGVRSFIFCPQLWKVCNLPATNAPTRTKNVQFGNQNNVRWSKKTSPLSLIYPQLSLKWSLTANMSLQGTKLTIW